jgi:peptidoglycan/LPS O-acetylase OafA/YrhL
MTNKPSADMPNLDVLRSVAVTFVVAAHTLTALGLGMWKGMNFLFLGPFGVYLFFVHTSLVLMWSLERRPNALDFYIRRAFRLYPLAILAVLIAAATHAPVSQIYDGKFTGIPITVMGVVMNCLLVNGLIGHQDLISGVMWSLPPDMFMYLLLPGLFFYARSVRRIWPLLVLWVFAVLFGIRFIAPSEGNVFPVLIPDFLGGVIAYIGFMRRKPVVPGWVFPPLLIAFFVSFEVLCYHTSVRVDWFVCLALGLILPSIQQLRAGWFTRAAHTLATYSYGIYLLHPFMIVLAIHVLHGKPLALQLAVELVPLAAASWLAYHFVERPLIGYGARVAAKLAHERNLPSEKSMDTMEPAP